jgi:polyhydroxyalkanoate synthesis regulator phasin
MTHTVNHLLPERGKFRRALAAVFSFLQAMEHTSFDYTLDRIERLEREVRQLKEKLRPLRANDDETITPREFSLEG